MQSVLNKFKQNFLVLSAHWQSFGQFWQRQKSMSHPRKSEQSKRPCAFAVPVQLQGIADKTLVPACSKSGMAWHMMHEIVKWHFVVLRYRHCIVHHSAPGIYWYCTVQTGERTDNRSAGKGQWHSSFFGMITSAPFELNNRKLKYTQ